MFYNYKVYRFYEFSATKNGADYAFLSAFGSDKKERLHSRRIFLCFKTYHYFLFSHVALHRSRPSVDSAEVQDILISQEHKLAAGDFAAGAAGAVDKTLLLLLRKLCRFFLRDGLVGDIDGAGDMTVPVFAGRPDIHHQDILLFLHDALCFFV